MIEQLSKDDWKEVVHPTYLCLINLYPLDLNKKFGIEFFEHIENGLGWICSSVVKINGVIYWLSAAFDPKNKRGSIHDDPDSSNPNKEAFKVLAQIRSYEVDQKFAYENLCNALGIDESYIDWRIECFSIAKWAVTRLDDNGNEIEMYRFHERKIAESVQKKYAAKGHKQEYFVHERT